ncbi:hypothetical protein KL910_005304 [Ogataea haglerorum]|nr:hypothetical protein KL945_005286 [Ogataea haglerorum]KAG7784110.1 hypothetical protein KL910_005304 [Ogataea haglerorum]
MAPITSYINLSPRMAVPIKTYVNRKEIQKNISKLTMHQTTLNLSRVMRITLSNKDLRRLYQDIKPILLSILLEYSPDHIRSISKPTSSGKCRIPLTTDDWECYLEITVGEIEELRQYLRYEVLGHNLSQPWLLIKDVVFKREEMADPLLAEEEDSKSSIIKYRNPQIIPIPLSIYVHATTK